jgi:hypothetical protein
MGSGTTLLAAHQLQRSRIIGIECAPATYAIACTRLQPLLPRCDEPGQAADEPPTVREAARQGQLFAAD